MLRGLRVIRINELSFAYSPATTPALNGVSMNVDAGSLFGLLGPNGAGKTTLLSIICGLLPCRHGAVQIGGADVARDRHAALAAIALVPQECAYYPTLTVRENLRFFARVQGLPAAETPLRIDEVAEKTGLGNRLDMRTRHLSGGYRRRLNIAIGLLNRPQLLLLDEPTVGIDPHSRHFILEAIRDINRNGTTVVYTSHYMEEVEYLCDDIAIIDDGKLLVQGSLDNLLRAGVGQDLVVDVRQPLTAAQKNILRQSLDFDEHDGRLAIHIGRDTAILPLLRQLDENGVDITRIHYGLRNLEELFLRFTHHSLRD